MLVTFAIFSVYAVSLNMLLGYTGLLSFGHAMFFGVGGYGTALALKHIEGIALFPAIGIGVLAAFVLALILTSPGGAGERDGLCDAASGFRAAFVRSGAQAAEYYRRRGRDRQFSDSGLDIPGVASFAMKGSPEHFYYLAMVILGISLWLMWFFTKTPFGQIQVGIRDNAKRIDYLGYKVPQSKAVIYVLSAAFAGCRGFCLRVVPQSGFGGRFSGGRWSPLRRLWRR